MKKLFLFFFKNKQNRMASNYLNEKNGFIIVLEKEKLENELESHSEISEKNKDLASNNEKKPIFTIKFPNKNKLNEHEIQTNEIKVNQQEKPQKITNTANKLEKFGEIKLFCVKYTSNNK